MMSLYISHIYLFIPVLVSLHLSLVSAQCPSTCECNSSIVLCHSLNSFPSSIPSGTRELIFDHCSFTKVTSDELSPFSGIESLTLTNSQITIIDNDAFSVIPSLRSLDISRNLYLEFTESNPYSFRGLPFLERLRLDDIGSAVIPSQLFAHLGNLTWLSLNRNSNNLPDFLFLPPTLKYLSLVNSNLNRFPAIPPLSELRELRLSRNDIAELGPTFFFNMSGLTSFECNFCGLEVVDKGSFSGLTSLNWISLSHNNLTSLDVRLFTGLTGLVEIHLDDNHLRTLSEMLVDWKNVKRLRLGHNPWTCDCYIVWMKSPSVQSIEDLENITCSSPETLHGMGFVNVTLRQLDNGNCHGRYTFAIVVGVLCILIGLILVAVCLRRKCKKHSMRRAMHKKIPGNYGNIYRETVEEETGLREQETRA